jgi:hypothetical protein
MARQDYRLWFKLAAWISPAVPVVVVLLFWAGVGDHGAREDVPILRSYFLACVLGFLSGVVSLFGLKANGPGAILPGAILGLLLNAGVGFLALLVWELNVHSH